MSDTDTMHGRLMAAVDHGHTTGRITDQDADGWLCWAWQVIGQRWLVIGSGEGDSEDAARTLAEARLADEVAKDAAPTAEGGGG